MCISSLMDFLGYLPFETLLYQASSSADMKAWPFAAQIWTMNYAYAAELWLQKTTTDPAVEYIGFAPDFGEGNHSQTREELGPLSFNQQEVEEAARVWKGTALTGTKAQEMTIKQMKQQPIILHFATHAVADEADVMRSRLYLEAARDQKEDGILYAYEIYGLRVNSPLTVLSACQTGRGPFKLGEGIMSLARAFQYAGSERVLTTLWQADDRAAASITTTFFQHLSSEVSPNAALQEARKQWLRNSDSYHCHPYFWASYVLIGDGAQTFVRARSNRIWVVGVICAGLLLIFGLLSEK